MSDIGHNGGPPVVERAGNWFAVSREIFTHSVVGIGDREYTELEAWLSMLAMAEYDERKVLNKGVMIVLDPGQLMAAHAYLSRRWKWSTDKVRWFLKRLEREAMITRYCAKHDTKRNTNQIQVITICNYGKFNNVETAQHQANYQPEHQANTKPTPSEHQANTKNLTTKPLNHQTIAVSTRAHEVADEGLVALNGTAIELERFIAKNANVDADVARRMLAANVRAFSAPAMLEAYSATIAEMGTGLVSQPYKFLIGCARRASERLAMQSRNAAHPKEGMVNRFHRFADEMKEGS